MSSRDKCSWSWFLRAGAVSALALATIAVAADPAAAGGSWLSPVRDRYEPGESVTLVGYVGPGGTLGSVEDGPFFAYLRRLDVPLSAPTGLGTAPFIPQSSDVPIGQLLVQDTGRPGHLAYRVSIQFRLPHGLPVGRYGAIYCNSTCTKGLSDLVGGVVFVGREPDGPISRSWPPDELERANLDGNVVPPAPPTSTPVTTGTATRTNRAVRHLSDRNDAEPGTWGWVLLALCVMAIAGAIGVIGLTRTKLRR
jgi:hypothetical protein